MAPRFVAFLLLLGALPCAGAGLPALKARTGPPVIEELMGGCSLRCAYPWEVFSGERPVYSTNDNDARSAWVDARQDGSVGSRLTFRFPGRMPPEMRGVPFYGFDIIDGQWQPDDGTGANVRAWKAHARAKRLLFLYNDKPLFVVLLADTPRWQKVSFDDIFIQPGDRMTLEILEVFPGREFAGVAISEIVLQGAH